MGKAKYVLTGLGVGIGTVLLFFVGVSQPVSSTSKPDLPNRSYTEACLNESDEIRPVWECYEIQTTEAPYTAVTVVHASGQAHRTLTFERDNRTVFRFTPSEPGLWEFSTGGAIEILPIRPAYAKGFVSSQGPYWTRSATGRAFVPQFVMYDKASLDEGLQEFVVEHGFTGFHIANLRDFLENPEYFESVVLKTYRQGGATHFWIWGDKSRRQTPGTYGVDPELLYREIAARLAPLPGWTVGWGFDNFEWADPREIEAFKETLDSYTSYRHLVGARGHKNRYRQISDNLDYVSWEWHRPDYAEYRRHLKEAKGKPTFSEDRFRIRSPSKYPGKDYSPELTRVGLWESLVAGGVANIWGHKSAETNYSDPYPNKTAIKTYRDFVDRFFELGMLPLDDVFANGHCLGNSHRIVCYIRDSKSLDLGEHLVGDVVEIIAIDTTRRYEELILGPSGGNIDLPVESDWAITLELSR